MYYKILVSTVFSESGNDFASMSTLVLEFDSRDAAENAYKHIEKGYPKHAIYATAVKLY